VTVPTYQYVCTECGDPHEAVQAFTDASLTTCPSCGGQLRKVFSAVGVVFKGSGFYRNDSRTASQPASTSNAGSSGEGGGSAAGDSAPSADKPAAKEGKPAKDSSSSASGSPSPAPAKTSGSGSAA
jgi:putative FmdB family regulatory protein